MGVLNRTVRWVSNPQRIEYEADPRRAEIAIAALELQAGKGVSSPAVKLTADELERGEAVLSRDKAKLYRSVAMRLQYLAQDRPDIQFPCKQRARFMAQPAERDWTALKRIARYLVSHPRLVWRFPLQRRPTTAVAFADSDHGGCLLTCKSTTGVALMLGNHCIRTNSNTQADLSLSSGEAEFYGAIKGSSVGLGAVAMMADLGSPVKLELRMDSTAGKAISERRGLGRTRHIATRYLWVQQRVAAGDFSVVKWPGPDNPADLGTKVLPWATIAAHLARLNCCVISGRAAGALQVQQGV